MSKSSESLERIFYIPDEMLTEAFQPLSIIDRYLISACLAFLPTVVFVMGDYESKSSLESYTISASILFLTAAFFFLVWNSFRMKKRLEKYNKIKKEVQKKYREKFNKFISDIFLPAVKPELTSRVKELMNGGNDFDKAYAKSVSEIIETKATNTSLDLLATVHQSYRYEMVDVARACFLKPLGNEPTLLVNLDKMSFSLRHYMFVFGITMFISGIILHLLSV